MEIRFQPNQAKFSCLKVIIRQDRRLGLSLVFRMVETNKMKQSRTFKALQSFLPFPRMRITPASINLTMFHLDDHHQPTPPSLLPLRIPLVWPRALASLPWMNLMKRRVECQTKLYSFLACLSPRGPREFIAHIHLTFWNARLSKPRTRSPHSLLLIPRAP